MQYLLNGMFGRACKNLGNAGATAELAAEVGDVRQALVDKLAGEARRAALGMLRFAVLCRMPAVPCRAMFCMRWFRTCVRRWLAWAGARARAAQASGGGGGSHAPHPALVLRHAMLYGFFASPVSPSLPQACTAQWRAASLL